MLGNLKLILSVEQDISMSEIYPVQHEKLIT